MKKLFFIAFIICKSTGLKTELTSNFIPVISMMLPGILIGAIGEEIGWRSFLQRMLDRKYSLLMASIITGLGWGLWHMGHYANGFRFMACFLIFTISASIILGRILRGTAYSLIVSVFFHASINISFLIFFKKSLSNAPAMAVIGFTWLIAGMGLIVLNRKILS